ncbi:helix-turn-helix domain-containing protein [Propionivibrio sp.]|uniref:helix-turn-helix transcriptional regulator n=1 Tax=Propionivibrio sp. TaxID=2212460 RepID=UPI00262A4C8C|nr:helix-turn-helix domain-containing protein [Propionivibrio sp.]
MALITLTEAASRAGVSRSTAERMIERGQFIACYQLPTGSLRFDDDELAQWLASCRTKTQQKGTRP